MVDLARIVSRVFAGGMAEIVFQPEQSETDPGIKLDITRATREMGYQPLIQLESGLQKLKLAMEFARESRG